MHSRAIEAYKRQLSLSQEQREILVGLLLGDGCLETQNGGRTYRLKIEQSIRHAAYVRHIHSAFEEWVLSRPRSKASRRKQIVTMNLAFQTVSHADFAFYAEHFYVAGVKRVPVLISEWLTPRGLAYWFMDDGSMKSRQSKGVIFNTHAFAREDVERLVGVLWSYRLEASIRRQSDGLQIYVSGRSHTDLTELIGTYVVEEMRYKLPPARRTQLPKR